MMGTGLLGGIDVLRLGYVGFGPRHLGQVEHRCTLISLRGLDLRFVRVVRDATVRKLVTRSAPLAVASATRQKSRTPREIDVQNIIEN